MKNYKIFVALGLIVLSVLSAYQLFSENLEKINQYNKALEKARYCCEFELVDAANYYDEVLSLNKSVDVYEEYVEFYLKQKDYSSAEGVAERLINDFPKDSTGYYLMLSIYDKKEDYKEFFSVYNTALNKKIKSEKIDELYKKNEYQYYDAVKNFKTVKNYMNGFYAVENDDGLWGYTDTSGSVIISCDYLYAGGFSGEMASVKDSNGSLYYVNEDNKRKFVLDTKEKYDYLGQVVDGIFAVGINKKYSYYNMDSKKEFGDFEYAGTFNCGIAAVKDGGKWMIIDKSGKAISEKYDEILMDDNDIACINNRVIAVKDKVFYILNEKGKVVKKTDFEDMAMISSDNLFAFKKGGKWGFCDENGKVKISPEYEAARSFSNEFAAVCKNGKWGYITSENKVVIDCKFDKCLDFNSKGCAYVCEDGESFKMIKLYKTNYD